MLSRRTVASGAAFTRQALLASQESLRFLSSSKGSGAPKKGGFRPHRRPGKNYRPLNPLSSRVKGPKEPLDVTRSVPKIDMSKITITDATEEDELEAFGPLAADAIRLARRQILNPKDDPMDVETQMKMMDYFTSAPGSTEELVGERRALAYDMWDHEDRDEYAKGIDAMIDEERVNNLELDPLERATDGDLAVDSDAVQLPENQLAHGDWGEMLVRTDRVKKMWRGGRIESFRALVIAGNLRGCGGFGIGKSFEPEGAVELACRMARRNIFFVDRYRNQGLTRDLVGRQNSCKVYLRSTDNGLRGNPLTSEILKLMGITNVSSKAIGNRNHYNVTRATFKGLLSHESLDEIAMKRGLRLVNLQKAKRLQI